MTSGIPCSIIELQFSYMWNEDKHKDDLLFWIISCFGIMICGKFLWKLWKIKDVSFKTLGQKS
jgi:hypothetical protein